MYKSHLGHKIEGKKCKSGPHSYVWSCVTCNTWLKWGKQPPKFKVDKSQKS